MFYSKRIMAVLCLISVLQISADSVDVNEVRKETVSLREVVYPLMAGVIGMMYFSDSRTLAKTISAGMFVAYFTHSAFWGNKEGSHQAKDGDIVVINNPLEILQKQK